MTDKWTLMGVTCRRDRTAFSLVEPSRPGRARHIVTRVVENDPYLFRDALQEWKPTYIALEWAVGADYDASTADAVLRRQAASGEFSGVAAILGFDLEKISRKKWRREFFGGPCTDAEFDPKLRQKFAFCCEGFVFDKENHGYREAPALAVHATLHKVAERMAMPKDLAALLEGP